MNWDRVSDWFYDTFIHVPSDADEERSWEDYETLALIIMREDLGEWGGRAGMDLIKGYLFWAWVNDIDYCTAVFQLRDKMSKGKPEVS